MKSTRLTGGSRDRKLASSPVQQRLTPHYREKFASRLAADYQQELVKLFNSFSRRHGYWKAFADFCEISAITLSNAIDLAQHEEREARYL